MPFNLSDLVPDEGSKKNGKRVGRGTVPATARHLAAEPRVRNHAQVLAFAEDLKADSFQS